MIKFLDKCIYFHQYYSFVGYKNAFKNCAFQYTRLHVVDEILKSGCLLATSVEFLNDTSEYNFAFNSIKKNCPELPEGEFRFFSISFTEKEDDVPQYMIYAGEIGVSIEYDFGFDKWGKYSDENDIESLENSNIKIYKPKLASYDNLGNIINYQISHPLKIEYKNEELGDDNIDNYVKLICDELSSHDNSEEPCPKEMYYYIPCFIKIDDFVSEEEVRFAIGACDYKPLSRINNLINKSDNLDLRPEQFKFAEFRGEEYTHTRIGYVQSQNKLLKPYVGLFFTDGKYNIGWPIKSIWVGPGRDQDRAFESIKLRLEIGDVMLFPLPLTEFIIRLINYYKRFFNDYLIVKHKWKVDFEKFLNLFDFDVTISYDRYEEEIRMARNVTIDGIKYDLFNQNYLRCLGGVNVNDDLIMAQNVSKDAKDIISKVKDVFIKKLADSYIKYFAKEELSRMIDPVPKSSNINKQWALNSVKNILCDFEKYNYFSTIGISVHKSIKNLAQY